MLKIKIFFYAIRPYQYFFTIYWLICGDLITSKLLGLYQKMIETRVTTFGKAKLNKLTNINECIVSAHEISHDINLVKKN